jgi:hypothetical protein
MTSWAPPEPDFGFRIVRGASAPPPQPRRWFQPAWGLAAAAVLVLAAAAAIAHVEVRYGQEGLVVRTGWARQAPAAPVVQTAGVPVLTPTNWKADYTLLDRRLRELETRGQNSNVQMAGTRLTDAELLRRVREIVGESETRQQQALQLRVNALAREVDRARRVDQAVMRQGLEGASGVAAARDTQLANYLRLVTQQR